MLSGYSFKRIANVTVAVIFVILFGITLMSVYLAHTSSRIVEDELNDEVEILANMPTLLREYYHVDEKFRVLQDSGIQDISSCFECLNTIRSVLDKPAFARQDSEHIRSTLLGLERKIRTMLYQYAAADLKDPTRDYGRETMAQIQEILYESETEAMNFCEDTQEQAHDTVIELSVALKRTKLLLVATLVIGCGLVMISVLFVRQALISRLHNITTAADNIRKGNLGYRIRSAFNDDLGRVSQSIDEMARQIELTETQLREANQQLGITLEEKCKADVAKSEFLANMSHELRTPMNSIIGFSEVLMEEIQDAQQNQYVTYISDAADSLLRLINDILDVTKIEAGKMEVEQIRTSIAELLAKLDVLLRPLAEEKRIELVIQSKPEVPESVLTDPGRLYQCLVNLASNAIKFTDYGTVCVEVSLQESEGDPRIQFSVSDTGIGIEKEKVEKIFESFTQADGSMSRKYGGTGLGLSITRQLVRLLGGDLAVDSRPSVGSVFCFSIPDVQPSGTGAAGGEDRTNSCEATSSGSTVKKRYAGTILVAEDNADNLRLIKLVLERFGLQIESAEDGEQAVRLCEDQSFDLIFMDMQMPGMNGYDATRVIREMGQELPIVALTANAMIGDKEKCIEVGCTEYLTKPFKPEQIDSILGKYLPLSYSAID